VRLAAPLLFVLAAAGCKGGATAAKPPATTCVGAGKLLAGAHAPTGLAQQIGDACRRDEWSNAVKDCIGTHEDPLPCTDQLTGEQHAGYLVARTAPPDDREPFLGVGYSAGPNRTAYVTEVIPKSPAEQVGIQIGDQITAYNGETLDENSELTALVRRSQIGAQVELTVLRYGSPMTVRATLVEKPKP
jgi:S1-C subfamily serine protease